MAIRAERDKDYHQSNTLTEMSPSSSSSSVAFTRKLRHGLLCEYNTHTFLPETEPDRRGTAMLTTTVQYRNRMNSNASPAILRSGPAPPECLHRFGTILVRASYQRYAGLAAGLLTERRRRGQESFDPTVVRSILASYTSICGQYVFSLLEQDDRAEGLRKQTGMSTYRSVEKRHDGGRDRQDKPDDPVVE